MLLSPGPVSFSNYMSSGKWQGPELYVKSCLEPECLDSSHASQVTHAALLGAGIGTLIPSGSRAGSLNVLGPSGSAYFLVYKSAFLSLSVLVLGLDRCFKLSSFTPGIPLF